MVFEDFKKQTEVLEIVINSVWLIDIILTFFRPEPKEKAPTLKSCAKRYILRGTFFLDIVTVIPPLATQEKYPEVNALKYLRLWHVKEIVTPLR